MKNTLNSNTSILILNLVLFTSFSIFHYYDREKKLLN